MIKVKPQNEITENWIEGNIRAKLEDRDIKGCIRAYLEGKEKANFNWLKSMIKGSSKVKVLSISYSNYSLYGTTSRFHELRNKLNELELK